MGRVIDPFDPRVLTGFRANKYGLVIRKLTPLARLRLQPLFARFGTDLSRAMFYVGSGAQTFTSDNDVTFGTDYVDAITSGSLADTLIHELVHVAQYQILATAGMTARGVIDRFRSGGGEKHYSIPPPLKAETLTTIDITDINYDLEAIAEHFADLAMAAHQYDLYR